VSECVFCSRIKSGDYNWAGFNCVSFVPLNPVVPGHILIVPRIHVTDFTMSPDVSADAMKAAGYAAKVIGGDFNLITSKGSAATQTIYHLHIHLVPRYPYDGLHLPWTGQD